MIRATVFALSLALLAAPGHGAGLEAWLASIGAAERDLDARCEALRAAPPPEGLVWLRLGPNGVEIVPADARAAAAAAFWAEAALGAKAAALALYGQAAGAGLAGAPVMIETGPDGVAVHDGGALRLGDPCDALRRMVSALGGAGASAQPFEDARRKAAARTALAIGGEAVLPLETAPAGAYARGPDGVRALIEETAKGDALLALRATGDAAPGEAEIRVYAPGDRFHPIAAYPIQILPGPAAPPAPPTGTLSPGGRIAGEVALDGAARIPVVVTEPGRVVFASGPEADFAATLETADGRVIAGDDDSGRGYGFLFSAELTPGRYFLSVNHCCGGGGAFEVIASPD
ncbi:hypothetical protein [Pikeienuella sp. HZG-20]|uniref:hypothetical protein n=1 Tax=Paludibacillus litoralis TaxID=3133267 RepID=UPI0030EEC824